MPDADAPAWSIRSVLVSVRDLDRSVAFYEEVMALREVVREGEVACLEHDDAGRVAIILREVRGQGTRHGQQSLGARAVCLDVGSTAALDEVEARLRAADAFDVRRPVDPAEPFEIVHGHDPDGLPLVFLTYSGAALSADHYRFGALSMYGLDV